MYAVAIPSPNRCTGRNRPLPRCSSQCTNFSENNWYDSIGTTATDTTRLIITAVVTAIAMSRNIMPTSICRNTTGKNTATVVSVDASTAPHTSRVPSYAARNAFFPMCRCRSMFSSTTIASSTSRPVANARPARLTRFSVVPSARITMNVPISDIGIETLTTSVDAMLRRNVHNTNTVKMQPRRMSSRRW